MVHVEHTSVAGRAMMASLWLENVTHQAVSSSFVFRIAQMEAPKDWHLARIRRHGLYEGPNKHEKQ